MLHPVTYLEPITPHNQQRGCSGGCSLPFLHRNKHDLTLLPFKHPWIFDAQLQGSHNGGNASSVKKNDSQNKKTKPIHHLMQSVIVLQPEHHTRIDYKQDDTSLWTVCYIIINKYPFIFGVCIAAEDRLYLRYTVNIPLSTMSLPRQQMSFVSHNAVS